MVSITLIIVILTAIISFTALSNQKTINDLIFYPPAISRSNQWYRFFTCALIHADFFHLLFNMFALYSFGNMLETSFKELFGEMGGLLFVLLYVATQFISLLPTYLKHKDDAYYRSLGASGAVSGVVFASIFLFPLSGVGIFPLPFAIPGFIFGFIYLGITMYLAKRGSGNINHSAHFFGAAAGIVLLLIFCYAFTTYDPVKRFIEQVGGYIGL